MDSMQHSSTITGTVIVHDHGPKSKGRKWLRKASNNVGTHCGCPRFLSKIMVAFRPSFQVLVLRTVFRHVVVWSSICWNCQHPNNERRCFGTGGAKDDAAAARNINSSNKRMGQVESRSHKAVRECGSVARAGTPTTTNGNITTAAVDNGRCSGCCGLCAEGS